MGVSPYYTQSLGLHRPFSEFCPMCKAVVDVCLPLSPVPDNDSVPKNSVVLRQAVPHVRDIWDIWRNDSGICLPWGWGNGALLPDDLPHEEQPHRTNNVLLKHLETPSAER